MEQSAELQKTSTSFNLRYLADSEGVLGGIFLFPALAYIIGLVAVPFFVAIAFSLSDVTVGDTSLDFVGLRNFQNIIRTPQFRRALLNTVLFTVISQFFIILLANILAVVLAQDFHGKWLARMLIMMPWATPIALGTIGWKWLFDSKFSTFDWLLVKLGLLGAPDALLGPGLHMTFLGREYLAMASVILVHIWRTLPLAAVILMAGLTSIDRELIDQAEVDGASFWRIHMQVKIPLVLPILYIALLFGLIFTFTDMTVVFILTRGGPVYYTQVLSVWAYFKGIDGGSLNEGAAIALFLFPVLLAVAILLLKTARRMEVR
jgi:multiple sugar transport system permease protein